MECLNEFPGLYFFVCTLRFAPCATIWANWVEKFWGAQETIIHQLVMGAYHFIRLIL